MQTSLASHPMHSFFSQLQEDISLIDEPIGLFDPVLQLCDAQSTPLC